jgi:hypothetical protein
LTIIESVEAHACVAEYIAYWVPRTRQIGVEPIITIRFAREQEEPLLLLADYLAGGFHHSDPRAALGEPLAPPADVRTLFDGLRGRHGPLLTIDDKKFGELYPLKFDAAGHVVRTDSRA